ncbi:hypothetical protein BLNAU_7795 [Blattamonas nauphoetae]|uniref:Uncharacterized protein n=1 Tax=Blattamonas nauphoetae TaxID=2049346 RepID=A0ABQ9Y0F2_9EUKA|nr:hypothetical protein BLNAU_7795 [Blattamonas nauphoetae]
MILITFRLQVVVLKPEVTQSFYPTFVPVDYTQQTDVLHMRARGEELSIPMIATPLYTATLLPPILSFGEVPIGQSVTKTFEFPSQYNLKYPFTIDSSHADTSLTFSHSQGVIPATGSLIITITFAPTAIFESPNLGQIIIKGAGITPRQTTIEGYAPLPPDFDPTKMRFVPNIRKPERSVPGIMNLPKNHHFFIPFQAIPIPDKTLNLHHRPSTDKSGDGQSGTTTSHGSTSWTQSTSSQQTTTLPASSVHLSSVGSSGTGSKLVLSTTDQTGTSTTRTSSQTNDSTFTSSQSTQNRTSTHPLSSSLLSSSQFTSNTGSSSSTSKIGTITVDLSTFGQTSTLSTTPTSTTNQSTLTSSFPSSSLKESTTLSSSSQPQTSLSSSSLQTSVDSKTGSTISGLTLTSGSGTPTLTFSTSHTTTTPIPTFTPAKPTPIPISLTAENLPSVSTIASHLLFRQNAKPGQTSDHTSSYNSSTSLPFSRASSDESYTQTTTSYFDSSLSYSDSTYTSSRNSSIADVIFHKSSQPTGTAPVLNEQSVPFYTSSSGTGTTSGTPSTTYSSSSTPSSGQFYQKMPPLLMYPMINDRSQSSKKKSKGTKTTSSRTDTGTSDSGSDRFGRPMFNVTPHGPIATIHQSVLYFTLKSMQDEKKIRNGMRKYGFVEFCVIVEGQLLVRFAHETMTVRAFGAESCKNRKDNIHVLMG